MVLLPFENTAPFWTHSEKIGMNLCAENLIYICKN